MKRLALKTTELAEALGVDDKTIRREISDGKLPGVKIRGCMRVLTPDVMPYLQRLSKEFAELYGFISPNGQ